MKISKQDMETVHSLVRPFRVARGKAFRLRDFDPTDTMQFGTEDKPRAQQALRRGVAHLAALQDMLYAQDRWSVLLVFQAMDAAGKDSAIKHVLSGVNPQGCHVTSFKARPRRTSTTTTCGAA
jgi:polyphosphate kinase 2 (PPK2 family)